MSAAYFATTVVNPDSFVNPANANDGNDATSSTKSISNSLANNIVSAGLVLSGYSGVTPIRFGVRVRHSITSSGTFTGKSLINSILYSADGGSTYNGTTISHQSDGVALTLADTEEMSFVTSFVTPSLLALKAFISIVDGSSSVGSATLNYTLKSLEIYPIFHEPSSMMGFS